MYMRFALFLGSRLELLINRWSRDRLGNVNTIGHLENSTLLSCCTRIDHLFCEWGSSMMLIFENWRYSQAGWSIWMKQRCDTRLFLIINFFENHFQKKFLFSDQNTFDLGSGSMLKGSIKCTVKVRWQPNSRKFLKKIIYVRIDTPAGRRIQFKRSWTASSTKISIFIIRNYFKQVIWAEFIVQVKCSKYSGIFFF